MPQLIRFLAVASLSLALGTTGCTIKSTVKQITDTTSNVTGTTSGAAWWSEDGQITPDFKATAFVAFNDDNLRRDLAAGQGEYLASMSSLLGVPADHQSAFFSSAQASYEDTIGKDAQALLARLRETSKPFTQ